MADLKAAVEELKRLYSDCPEVQCFACGACCVGPHMTFIEFLHLLEVLLREQPPKTLIDIVRHSPPDEPAYEGNIKCALQHGSLCSAREGRTLSCRLEGLPAVDALFNREAPLCPRYSEKTLPMHTGTAEVEMFIERLNAISALADSGSCEPYWVDGLNLECWFAVLLDPGITQEYFLDLRRRATALYDLEFLRRTYRNRTHLKEKIDLVDAARTAIELRNFKYARKLLKRIVGGFPKTGTFYYWQALMILHELEDVTSDVD